MDLLEQISQTHTIFNWPALIFNYSHNNNAHILDTNLSLFVLKERKACESTSTLTLIWRKGIKIHEPLSTELMQALFAWNIWWHCKPIKAWKTISHMIVFFWISSKSPFHCRTHLWILHYIKFSKSIFSK